MNFLISGTYCSSNKGDAEIQIAAYEMLKEIYPQSKISLLSPFPKIDRKSYRNIHIAACSRRNPLKSFIQLSSSFLWYIFYKFSKLDINNLIFDKELKRYYESDFLIDVSGDGLTEDYGWKATISHSIPILISYLLNKPIIVLAQTIGPFYKTKFYMKKILNLSSLITLRENISKKYMENLGFHNLEVTGDLAFLFNPAKQAEAKKIFKEYNISKKEKFIGITVSNLANHRHNQFNKKEAYTKTMAEISDYMVESTGSHILFFGHVTGPTKNRDDRVIARKVINKMKNKDKATLFKEDLEPSKLKALIGLCDMFMGVRMHSNIGALSMHVPTLAIAYSYKSYGIMEKLDQKKWICDIRKLSLKNMKPLIDKLFKQRKSVKKELTIKMRYIKKEVNKNKLILKAFFENRRRNLNKNQG